MPELVYLNGWTGSFDEAFTPVNDRGYVFGDGIYEVIRVYNGKLFGMQDHLQRLESSAAAVEIKLPCGAHRISLLCEELLEKSGFKDAMIYIQISRGTAPRNHFYDPELKPNLLITVRDLPDIPPYIYTEGINVITHSDFRWQLCNVKSISLQANVLAKNKARQAGALEVIFVLPDGTVTECGSSNIFIFQNDVLRTHPESNKILPGITRKHIINVAKSLGIDVREEPFSLEQLWEAAEVFCTNTIEEVMPVVNVDGKVIGSGRPGPVTKRLHQGFKLLQDKTKAARIVIHGTGSFFFPVQFLPGC